MSTHTHARRLYDAAEQSLWHAEALRDELAALAEHANLAGNPYYHDAVQRADELCAEMTDNLQDVMDRFTPEQCGFGA